MRLDSLALDDSPASPWLLIPPDVRAGFDRLVAAGAPLAESTLGRPLLGVKCGCNEAFVVTRDGPDASPFESEGGPAAPLVPVRSREQRGTVEGVLLRPLVRGTTLSRWRAAATGESIVWTHADDGRPLPRLPTHAERWLGRWRSRLERRADRRAGPWWALFRTESASPALPRVTWSDFGRVPRAAVLPAGDPTVALNTCYVIRCVEVDDAYALAALLNARLVAAWLDVLAEPARGGYRRYLGWTVGLLPIPPEWPIRRRPLAALGRRAWAGEPVADDELLAATLTAYRVNAREVQPLLAWSAA